MMKKYLLAATAMMFLFASCGKDDPDIPPVPELITTLNYTLTPTNGPTVILSFQDIDGDGGMEPTITGGTLSANTTYSGSMELLNESVSPSDNITEEIEEEDEEHQFFFTTTVAGLTLDYSDVDENDNPVGLNSSLVTTSAGSGTLTIILRHEPDKEASGVSDGDFSNAGGETDIEVTFPIDVQ